MDKAVYNELLNETSQDLFYYFKHDTLVDFQKKLVSGILLHERGYNNKELQQEKALNLGKVNSYLKYLGSASDIEVNQRVKVRKAIINRMFIFVLSFVTFFVLHVFVFKHEIESTTFIPLGAVIVYFAFAIFQYNNTVNKNITEDLRQLDIQRKRLKWMEKYWAF
ncbi:hypothetical protein EMN47_17425 [Prolixibacteraceae bacterium JC049]|nr:hypothetical protein [Prolixibacteraceae bacterium JC049]